MIFKCTSYAYIFTFDCDRFHESQQLRADKNRRNEALYYYILTRLNDNTFSIHYTHTHYFHPLLLSCKKKKIGRDELMLNFYKLMEQNLKKKEDEQYDNETYEKKKKLHKHKLIGIHSVRISSSRREWMLYGKIVVTRKKFEIRTETDEYRIASLHAQYIDTVRLQFINQLIFITHSNSNLHILQER